MLYDFLVLRLEMHWYQQSSI